MNDDKTESFIKISEFKIITQERNKYLSLSFYHLPWKCYRTLLDVYSAVKKAKSHLKCQPKIPALCWLYSMGIIAEEKRDRWKIEMTKQNTDGV